MAKKRTWTVLVFVVAKPLIRRPDAHGDAHYMNSKADEVRAALDDAVKGLEDVYLAYDIIYDPADNTDPRFQEPAARIVNPDASERDASTGGWFQSRHDLNSSFLEFYAWALPKCPAHHYASFFWGHSFGPAGLFKVGKAPVLPHLPLDKTEPLSMPHIRTVLRKSRVCLDMEGEFTSLHQAVLDADPEQDVCKPNTTERPRVDVVLFQDCWMSTLETAFQLKDSAQFIVASQSLVPFGKPSVVNSCGVVPSKVTGEGVWPYRKLFEILLRYSSKKGRLDELVGELGRFYDRNNAREIWPNPSLPFALLDLDAIRREGMADSLAVLVRALHRVRGRKPERGAFMEAASIAVSGENDCPTDRKDHPTELTAGSIALIDLKELCVQLCKEDLDPDERDAIVKLRDTGLVVARHESVATSREFPVFRPETPEVLGRPLTANGLGFSGVSFFYHPTTKRAAKWAGQDEFIFPDVSNHLTFFNDLFLSREVTEAMVARGSRSNWASALALEQL